MSAPSVAPYHRVSVFISYSTQESGVAKRLRQHIEGNGVKCFIAEDDITGQRYWEPEIKGRVSNCQLFLLLFSRASRDSPEVLKEVELATALNKEIWVVELEPAKITDIFKGRKFMERQFFRPYVLDETSSFNELLDEIDKRWTIPDTRYQGRITLENCPYPGPAPFSGEFSDVFFGRLKATEDLKVAVNGNKRVLLVWGPSGAGKTSLLTVGLKEALPAHCFYSGPVDGSSAHALLAHLGSRVRGEPGRMNPVPDTQMAAAIVSAIAERPENECLFCFDQMENFFTWPPPPLQEINRFLGCLQTVIKDSPKRVTTMISFRKESLADVQPHVKRFFEGIWGEFIVRKLTSQDAVICITEPAAQRKVQFDERLARAIVRAIEQDQGGGDPVVDPMNVQKVCQALWREMATTNSARLWCIDGNVLPEILGKDEGLERNASEYVGNVLREYLRKRITEIANSLPRDTTGPKPDEYVLLSLLEFVGPNNVRQRVRETGINEQRRIGRLSLDVVNQLVGSGLVQRCGDKEYELAHDALADEIGKYGEGSAFVSAMKSLDSVLELEKKSSQSDSGFNRDSELLSRLEPVRDNKWPFQEKEAELIFRRALGDHRRSVRGGKISVDAWAQILAEKAPDRLIKVLEDALSDGQEAVQLDALELVRNPEIRELVRGTGTEPLGSRLRDISLNGELSHAVREKASLALALLGYEKTIGGLFDSFARPETRYQARTALALVRHAEDTSDSSTPAFKAKWNSVGWFGRLGILTELWRWRWQKSYSWILYMVAVAAPVTAIGAALPFIPLGHYGASLTMDPDFGIATGIFHGLTGGLVWGIGVTAGLLFYCIILRGGRIRQHRREAVGMAIAGVIGGAIGGLANTAVIALVFAKVGLYRGGWFWTEYPSLTDILNQIFFMTFHGWITPLFGAALGVGIGLSLHSILSDPNERWIGSSAAPLAKGETKKSLRRICLEVLQRSWCNALWIAVGVLLTLLIIRPGPGTCDPTLHPGRPLLPDCNKMPSLPPTWERSAGLGLVILGGSLGQEIAFLFGLLSVQFGVNLRENREFMRSAHLGAKT